MNYQKYYYLFPILFLIMGISISSTSQAQIIRATGNSTEASSQLIFYYDELEEGDTAIQVTNTNDTQGVWVHVQIFRSYNSGDSTNVIPVFCDERDFVDFYTPNDTHIYTLDEDNFDKNIGSDEVTPGESSSIVDIDETKGFVVVTPIVSEADFTAISFQWMIGNTLDTGLETYANAMGRDAVDFSTGEILADGTPLDGTSSGFVLLQPKELIFDFANPSTEVDIVEFAWADVYGGPGLLGYAVQPSTATLQPFIFDFKEDVTSCGVRNVDCFLTLGLNEDLGQNNEELTPVEDLLCAGAQTPQYADGNYSNFDSNWPYFGWTRMFVSGLGNNANLIGLVVHADYGEEVLWMNTRD